MTQPLPYCVYVLRSQRDGNLYIGYTTDLARRLEEHNSGENQSTAPRRPLVLVYCEFHACVEDAQRREKYLKTSTGGRGLKLMLRETLGLAARAVGN
jgi:putative endonuclease